MVDPRSQPAAPEPEDPGLEDGERDSRRRRSDHIDRWISLLTITMIIGMTLWFEIYTHERSTQRRGDLRAQCRRTSRKTATNVDLNWVYYQSEVQLNREPSSAHHVLTLLASLSPGERRFLRFLIGTGQPSREILRVRANADFNAAYVNAQTVDYRDLHLIPKATPLGSARSPRQWVRQAHFSCDRVFP